VKVAVPELSVPVPRVAVPFMKVTVPVGDGTPEAPVTVAVNVTLAPTAMEAAEAVNAVVVAPEVTLTTTAPAAEAVFLLSPA
jgi:hypothetical protein